MKRYSEKELQVKMYTFMVRKVQKYPELLPIKKGEWTIAYHHATSSRLFSVARGLSA
jgi:hypothetical protein